MTTQFPEEDIEFRSAWSSCAGKLAGLKEASAMALADASYLWVHTDEANSAERLKDLGNRLKRLAEEESERLQSFIKESERRGKVKQ
jgi:hypothetical protein